MKRLTTLALAFALSLATSAQADEPKGMAMPDPIKAGPEQAHYPKMAGKWNIAQTMFMPDGKTMKSTATQETRVVLGGLGIAFDFEGSMGPDAKMLGHGFHTYAPGAKKYETYWFDNYSTFGASHGWGTWDEKTKTMREEMRGPGPDGKEMVMRSTTVVESDDKHTMTMFMVMPDGKEMKLMEMVYTRAK